VPKLKKNYPSLTGYRLPTEAEVEYATRAGAVTSLYYRETAELLDKYGWYTKDSRDRTWSVGGLKPNDLGLFDLHGNVYTWCQESYKGDYAAPKGAETVEDKEDHLTVEDTGLRMLRGNSFFAYNGSLVRSAYRYWLVPATRHAFVGFRPTVTP
jgi:formylglycine-generating enzyme required for sulfatase activity